MAIAAGRSHHSLLSRIARSLSSSTASLLPKLPEKPIVDLTDTHKLFGSAATGELMRSLAMMCAMAVGPAVDLGIAMMRSPAVMGNAKVRAAVMAALRGTVYQQFCAGEGIEDAAATLRRLWMVGLRGILVYGLEDAADGGACDRNLAEFLQTVDLTAALPSSSCCPHQIPTWTTPPPSDLHSIYSPFKLIRPARVIGERERVMAVAIRSRRELLTCLLRSFSSFTTSPTVLSPPMLDLEDTERLYASEPTSALLCSLATLHAMAMGPAVDLGMAVLRSKAVMETPAVHAAVMAAVRRTVYRQFCAGENVDEAAITLRRLWDSGLRGILDYGLEDASDGGACDRNLAEFLRTVEMTVALPADSVSFACVKITAICPIELLERVSDLLRWEKKHPSSPLQWKQASLPILTNSSPLNHTLTMPDPLSQEEELELQRSHDRLSALGRRCAEANLPLLVDAEYTSVQPAIDYMIYSAAVEFNKEHPIIYGTIQTYLKDSKERLIQAVEAAERAGISIGFKLVRGAYLSRESKLASSLGVDSPIHKSIEETHACYNDCAAFMLERIVKGSAAVVLATHNLDSGRAAAAKAEEMGIGKGEQNLQFAQLMGMADGLSLGLKNAGFQVSKYLPFGPVNQVIPYLLRRAEENRGFLSTSALDRELIRKELKRRLKVAVLGK